MPTRVSVADKRRRKVVAATLRCVLALVMIWLGGTVSSALGDYVPVFAAYGVLGVVMLVLIWQDRAEPVRLVIGGLSDLAIITLIVHETGTTHSGLVSLYMVHTGIYATVATPRVGATMATGAVASYAGLVTLEVLGILPYAPGAPAWIASHPPTGLHGLRTIVVILTILIATALCFVAIRQQIQVTEDELKKANEALAAQTRTDALTGLWNRRHLEQAIGDSFAWLKRGRPFVAIAIDLDGFKRVNDTLGHLAGDGLLTAVANALAECTRDTDLAARTGGDEFILVLNGADEMQGCVVATRVVDSVREIGSKMPESYAVTASVGLAAAGPDDTIESLLDRADRFAYKAKREGGNRLCG